MGGKGGRYFALRLGEELRFVVCVVWCVFCSVVGVRVGRGECGDCVFLWCE
jgi:hypothetical protein